MSVFTIAAGKHYHRLPPLSVLPWVGAQSMARYVTFGESARYDAPAYHGQDVNKLFGLSFGFGGVHHNSARFGWRWSRADQCIEVLAYVYNEGQRNWDAQMRFPVVAQLLLGKRYRLEVFNAYVGLRYAFAASICGGTLPEQREFNEKWPGVYVPHSGTKSYGLTHGLYFGGALPAPHVVTVQIDRP